MNTLIVDIDNVVCDFNGAMISYINSVKNTNYSIVDLKHYSYVKSKLADSAKEWKNLVDEFFNSSYAANMKPVPGAIESIQELMNKYTILYVSARRWHLFDKTVKMLDTWKILPKQTNHYGRHDSVRLCGNEKKHSALRWHLGNSSTKLAGMIDDNESEFVDFLADPQYAKAKFILLSSIRESHANAPAGVEKCVLWSEVMQHL